MDVSCDYERPGKATLNGDLLDIPSITGGCRSGKYVVSLSDGAVLTNFWIDAGHVAQIDRFDANPVDL